MRAAVEQAIWDAKVKKLIGETRRLYAAQAPVYMSRPGGARAVIYVRPLPGQLSLSAAMPPAVPISGYVFWFSLIEPQSGERGPGSR